MKSVPAGRISRRHIRPGRAAPVSGATRIPVRTVTGISSARSAWASSRSRALGAKAWPPPPNRPTAPARSARAVSSCRSSPARVVALRRGAPVIGSRSRGRTPSFSLPCPDTERAAPMWASVSRHSRVVSSQTTAVGRGRSGSLGTSVIVVPPRPGGCPPAGRVPSPPATRRPTAGTAAPPPGVPTVRPAPTVRSGVPSAVDRRSGPGPRRRSPARRPIRGRPPGARRSTSEGPPPLRRVPRDGGGGRPPARGRRPGSRAGR